MAKSNAGGGLPPFVDYLLRATYLLSPLLVASNVPAIMSFIQRVVGDKFDYRWVFPSAMVYAVLWFLKRLAWNYGHEWEEWKKKAKMRDASDVTLGMTKIALCHTESQNEATRAFIIAVLGLLFAVHLVLPESASQSKQALSDFIAHLKTDPASMKFAGALVIPSVLLLWLSYPLQTRLSLRDAFIKPLYRLAASAMSTTESYDQVSERIKRTKEDETFIDEYFSSLSADPESDKPVIN